MLCVYHCHLYSGLVIEVTQVGNHHLLFSLSCFGQFVGLLSAGVSPLWLSRTDTSVSEALVLSRDEEMVLQLVNPVFLFRLIASFKRPILVEHEPHSSASWTCLCLGSILVCRMEVAPTSPLRVAMCRCVEPHMLSGATDGSKLQPLVGIKTHIKQ